MLHFFLNPWMLAGLAGVLLPVLAHLLSRKKYDIVEWGAMQFLQLDPSARRKLRLEELLLLFVRMALIALIAIALARPWFSGNWLGRWASTQSRDVVIVIDGSYSMGWEGKAVTPQANAVRLARQFVDDLRPGDTVMMLDAREQPRPALPGPTRDRQRVREVLDDLPAPSGMANLHEAIAKAVQILATGTNLQREVVVFTDQQALSWKPDDDTLWARIDDLREQSTLPPRIWVMDAAEGQLGKTANFTIERLQLSRELAVPGVPVRISSKVRYRGGETPITRKVFLDVNGQRLADQTLQIKLAPEGEATVEFEQRFTTAGSKLISVVLDSDALPGDNRSDAVIVVAESLPVVLVDGDKRLDPTRSETFFAKAALSAAGADVSWIKPSVLTPEELNADTMRDAAIVVLANVASIKPETMDLLERFVSSGHGLLFALGDKVPKEGYVLDPDTPAAALFPAKLTEIATAGDKETLGVRVAGNSLELPWLRSFRAEQGGTLTDARFSKWWRISGEWGVGSGQRKEGSRQSIVGSAQKEEGRVADDGASGHPLPTTHQPLTIAKLTNGDAWIVTRRHGRGMTAVLTSSLDADWNTLPAQKDYVPWLHELLFSLASTSTSRNVEVGAPLSLNVSPELKLEQHEFIGPGNKSLPAERTGDDFQPGAILNDVTLPGVYRFTEKSKAGKPSPTDEYFVANFDRGESDLTLLTDAQRQTVSGNGRLTFATDLADAQKQMFADTSRTEFWWMLIYGFLALMSVEVWMTRRMLRGATDAPSDVG
jgi:von Willebrand factor type A domain/Aerotolerance regulator N-terminal